MAAPGSRLSRLLHLRCRTQPPLPARGRSSSGNLPLTPSIDPPDDSHQTLKERNPQTGPILASLDAADPTRRAHPNEGSEPNTAQPSVWFTGESFPGKRRRKEIRLFLHPHSPTNTSPLRRPALPPSFAEPSTFAEPTADRTPSAFAKRSHRGQFRKPAGCGRKCPHPHHPNGYPHRPRSAASGTAAPGWPATAGDNAPAAPPTAAHPPA